MKQVRKKLSIGIPLSLFLICIQLAPLSPSIALDDARVPLLVRGVVEAVDRATLATGISSKIVEIGFRRGESFKKGDTLVKFACKRQIAVTKSAKAAYNVALQRYKKEHELLNFDATGKFDVEIAKAERDQALAEYNGEQAVLSQCTIDAPYDGIVVANLINTHETPQAGQPIIEIVNRGKVEVSMIAPSSTLAKLEEGSTFSFKLDDISEEAKARIDTIGAVVDPVSQTIEIISVIEDAGPNLRPGMGGIGDLSTLEKNVQ